MRPERLFNRGMLERAHPKNRGTLRRSRATQKPLRNYREIISEGDEPPITAEAQRSAPRTVFHIAQSAGCGQPCCDASGILRSIRGSAVASNAGHSARPVPDGLPVVAKLAQYAWTAAMSFTSSGVGTIGCPATSSGGFPQTNTTSEPWNAPQPSDA